jgi:aldehyde:ferredoxin oxidoreductase
MYGYTGKVLIVNLSDQSHEVKDLNPEWARDFVGGAALGARYLYDLMPANTPVFAPESVVGFVSGPANGTKSFMGGRYTVVSKSPVTGGWNDANSGGNFGPYLRKAGFDAVFVKGISAKPVYIFIDDGKVELRDASSLWGKTTSETEAALKAEIGDDNICAALIGPAGERLSNMAAVMNDGHRAAARGGPGAVVGSKKLKAVVCRGSQTVSVKNAADIAEINKSWKDYAAGPGSVAVRKWGTYGTAGDYEGCVFLSDAGIKNWTGAPEDLTEAQIKALSSQVMDPKYRTGKYACNSCQIGCGAHYHVKNEKLDLKTCRPEYETCGAFGSMLLNGDDDCVHICNWYCNEYGYDTISFGGTLAWLMDCYDQGIFTLEELEGIDLKWGNAEAIIAMAKCICNFEGIGVALNGATKAAAEHFGKGFECLKVAGGIEIPMHGSRNNPALARTYQYDPTPARHVKGGRGVGFGFGPAEMKYNYEGTGEADKAGLVDAEFCNAAGFCTFAPFLDGPGVIYSYVDAITGEATSAEERVKTGLRSYAMRSAFNLREGMRRKDYTISDSMVGKPPLARGPLAGITVDNERLGDNFFEALGWDVETGVPSKEFLENIGGLDFVAGDLYPGA